MPRKRNEHHPRQAFLDAMAAYLVPPRTRRKAQASNRGAHFRVANVAENVYLGIDALEDGDLRVHFFSDDPRRGRDLALLASDHFGPLPARPPALPAPRYRSGEDNPNRTYFGFSWHCDGDYGTELARARAAVDWLVALRPRLGEDAPEPARVSETGLTGRAFAEHLLTTMKASWSAAPGAQPGAWTNYMTEVLFAVADELSLGVCSKHGTKAPPSYEDATRETGWRREFLYDFTYFAWATDYELPQVILEHENAWSKAEFLADFWKLLFGYAPVRVMIGYGRDAAALAGYSAEIRRLSETAGWRYPNGVEDLVLLRDPQMPVGFQVLSRDDGSATWNEWPSIEAYLRG